MNTGYNRFSIGRSSGSAAVNADDGGTINAVRYAAAEAGNPDDAKKLSVKSQSVPGQTGK